MGSRRDVQDPHGFPLQKIVSPTGYFLWFSLESVLFCPVALQGNRQKEKKTGKFWDSLKKKYFMHTCEKQRKAGEQTHLPSKKNKEKDFVENFI